MKQAKSFGAQDEVIIQYYNALQLQPSPGPQGLPLCFNKAASGQLLQ